MPTAVKERLRDAGRAQARLERIENGHGRAHAPDADLVVQEGEFLAQSKVGRKGAKKKSRTRSGKSADVSIWTSDETSNVP